LSSQVNKFIDVKSLPGLRLEPTFFPEIKGQHIRKKSLQSHSQTYMFIMFNHKKHVLTQIYLPKACWSGVAKGPLLICLGNASMVLPVFSLFPCLSRFLHVQAKLQVAGLYRRVM